MKFWEMTVEEYLDNATVVGKMPPGEISTASLSDLTANKRYQHVLISENNQEYEFHVNDYEDLRIVHAPTKETVGTWARSHIYMNPDHRGKNLVAEMYFLMENKLGMVKDKWNLSPMSFSVRRKAHAFHVRNAIREGRSVPDRVLSQYDVGKSGNLHLKAPYTVDKHRERAVQKELSDFEDIIRSGTSELEASFLPESFPDEGTGALNMRDFMMNIWHSNKTSLAFASTVIEQYGGHIRAYATYHEGLVGEQIDRICLCAVVDDRILNMTGAFSKEGSHQLLFGMRMLSEEASVFEGMFLKGVPVEVREHDFSTAEECVEWLERAEIDMGEPINRRLLNTSLDKASNALDLDLSEEYDSIRF